MSDTANTPDELQQALAERDDILSNLDIERARTFIAEHGGYVAARKLDWLKILHLARFEVSSLPEDVWRESQLYLAWHGAQRLVDMRPNSPYYKSAIDLLFPRRLTDQELRRLAA